MNQDTPDPVSELLRRAADDVVPPPVAPSADLARGRRRLRRRRLALGAATAVVVVGAGTGVAVAAAGHHASPTADVATDPTAGPTSSPPIDDHPSAPPQDAHQLLVRDRDVIAEHLDPDGTHLARHLSNFQSGYGLGTKLGWRLPGESGEGEVEFYVAKSWKAQDQWFCGTPGFACHDETFGHGADAVTATVTHANGQLGVGVQRDDGSVVTIEVSDLFGNDSVTPVSGVDLSVEQLAHAAADPRIEIATQEQIDGASHAFGYPDLPPIGGTTGSARRHVTHR